MDQKREEGVDDRPILRSPFAPRDIDDIFLYYDELKRDEEIERDLAIHDGRGFCRTNFLPSGSMTIFV